MSSALCQPCSGLSSVASCLPSLAPLPDPLTLNSALHPLLCAGLCQGCIILVLIHSPGPCRLPSGQLLSALLTLPLPPRHPASEASLRLLFSWGPLNTVMRDGVVKSECLRPQHFSMKRRTNPQALSSHTLEGGREGQALSRAKCYIYSLPTSDFPKSLNLCIF